MQNLFSMMGLRTGSWGTPEFGLSEAVGSLLGSPRTSQGGSDIFANKPTASAKTTGGGTTGGGGNSTGVTPAGVTPAPQPANQPFNIDEATKQALAAEQGATEDMTGRVRSEIESAYQPIFDELDKQIGMLPEQRKEFETQIANLAGNQVTQAGEVEKRGIASLEAAKTGEESQAAGSLRDLEQDIRNQLKAATMYFGARGAASSSAPYAASEAITRGGLQARGKVLSARDTGINQIRMKQEDVKSLATEQVAKIDEWKNTKLMDISQWATNRLSELGTAKAQAGSQKGMAIANLIQNTQAEFINRLRQLDDAVINYKSAVSTWQTQRQAELEDFATKLGIQSQYTSTTAPSYKTALDTFNKLYNTGNMTFTQARQAVQEQFGIDPLVGLEMTPEQEAAKKQGYGLEQLLTTPTTE